MRRDVRLHRDYPHPRALVWRALTEPDLLAEWLMPNDFAPVQGRRFTLRAEPAPGFDGIVSCEVLEIDAPYRMRWSWRGGPIDTEVTFALEPIVIYAREGTRLTVEHTGFEGLPAVLVSFILQSGNRSIYGRRLPALLDRLAAGEGAIPGAAGGEPTCSEEPGLWQVLAHLFAPILRRAESQRQRR